jgi:hypothetical protein
MIVTVAPASHGTAEVHRATREHGEGLLRRACAARGISLGLDTGARPKLKADGAARDAVLSARLAGWCLAVRRLGDYWCVCR